MPLRPRTIGILSYYCPFIEALHQFWITSRIDGTGYICSIPTPAKAIPSTMAKIFVCFRGRQYATKFPMTKKMKYHYRSKIQCFKLFIPYIKLGRIFIYLLPVIICLILKLFCVLFSYMFYCHIHFIYRRLSQ